jgi:hypothetical protein
MDDDTEKDYIIRLWFLVGPYSTGAENRSKKALIVLPKKLFKNEALENACFFGLLML